MRQPIGFFDSGVGGLSILRAVQARIPWEDTLYLADSANCPYGLRDESFLLERSFVNTEWLLAHGSKAIVVACNTATAAAIRRLRLIYQVPFIGVEPAVKPAAASSWTGVVGVLATAGTLHGRHFKETSSQLPEEIEVVVHQVRGWVEAIERGHFGREAAEDEKILALVRRELKPILEAGADVLVLGCTHFPFLKEAIQKVVGEMVPERCVQLFDPSEAVARQTEVVLKKHGLLLEEREGQGKHEYFTTGDFEQLAGFIKKEAPHERIVKSSF